MGRDPLDEQELKFVYEGDGFVAMPTLAVVVARNMLARTLPLDWTKSVFKPGGTARQLGQRSRCFMANNRS